MEWMIGFAPFVMVIGIVWIVKNGKLEEKRIEAAAQGTAERAAQYASSVTELEDRVRVLERIVTDKGYDVSAQIEALRDQRRVDETGAGVPLEIRQRGAA